MSTATLGAHHSSHRRFRVAVIVATVVAATAGCVLLATRHPGDKATTRGITATVAVPGHPGSIVAGPGVLWVALIGDPRRPVGDMPLVRFDLARGTPPRSVHVGGEVSSLVRVGDRLIASVKPAGDDGFGRRRLVALDWRSGAVLALGQSHRDDAVAREFDRSVDRVVHARYSLWALEARPGRLLRLNPFSLVPTAAPIRLSSGRTLGLAAGKGYLWATAADAGDVLRIDPATREVTRAHVGGYPVDIVVARGSVWLADRSGGTVVRLDPDALRTIGDPIRVGTRPNRLAAVGDSLFVTDEDAGTVARVDLRSGRRVGQPIRVGPADRNAVAANVTPSGRSVWVSNFASNTVTRISPPVALAALSGGVTVAGTGDGPVAPGPNGMGVTDGSVAGTGRFTFTGAIDDRGTFIGYRRVEGQIAKVRSVMTGKKGTITFVTTIDLTTASSAWTIVSATKSYAGLHGKGALIVDNYESDPYTFVMKGTVSR